MNGGLVGSRTHACKNHRMASFDGGEGVVLEERNAPAWMAGEEPILCTAQIGNVRGECAGVVAMTGIEPATYGFEDRSSTN